MIRGMAQPIEPVPSDHILADPNFDTRLRDADPSALPKQQSLFPPDELVVPATVREMTKAVSAIHAVPTKPEYDLTLNGRRLFDALIVVAQLECRGREDDLIEKVKLYRASPMFEVRLARLAEIAGIPGKNFVRLYAELDHLYEMDFAWNVVSEDKSVEWEMRAHFLSLLGHGKNFKKGYVRFAFDAEVLKMVLEPSCWAKLSLEIMSGLKTGASYALYQNAWRYIGTKNKVTATLPTHIWIELLVGKSRFVTEPEAGQRVVDYGEFKRRVLTDAIARVNSVTALTYLLELKEIRSGNRVAFLQFKFIAKSTLARNGEIPVQLGIPMMWPADIRASLESIGYTVIDIQDLAEAHSLEDICDAIKRLDVATQRMKEKGQRMQFPRQYLDGILRNMHAAEMTAKVEDEKAQAALKAEEARHAAEERRARYAEQFQAHQRHRFSDWLFDLDEWVRNGLIGEFLEQVDPITRNTVKGGYHCKRFWGSSAIA